ncbi:hypothetical protein M885DRAFT_522062 [Pelagophyceae sp. CCMP2097]|nr:hypothetical protein M885DRAFT_522062 [Pelagophyceae sp. CCMP2097]
MRPLRAGRACSVLVACAGSSQARCADEPLWVDGVESSCAESGLDCATWFCPECSYAAACDAACGYCAACDAGSVRDCNGICLSPADCAVSGIGLSGCAEWKGNGCCDDGSGYVSDRGLRPDWNCAAHGWDGGDCDVHPRDGPPSWVVPEGDARWCVLLTATICPSQTMSHTVRRDAKIRLADYAAAVSKWANGGTRLRVVVVENSGANLDSLRAIAPAFGFVSFHDIDAEAATFRGKGHAEYRAVRFAMQSEALMGCDNVVKVTGRYFVKDLDSAISSVPETAELVVQSTSSPWTLWDGVLRCEVVGFKNDFAALENIFGGQDESAGAPSERTLFVGARAVASRGGVVAAFPRLAVDATLNAEESHLIVDL